MIKFYNFILLVVAPMCVPVLWKSTLRDVKKVNNSFSQIGNKHPHQVFLFLPQRQSPGHQVTLFLSPTKTLEGARKFTQGVEI